MQVPSILQGQRPFDLIKGGIAGAILITAVGFNWAGYGFGWTLGGTGFAGHLVGEFPHEIMDAERVHSYIAPGNTTPMRGTDRAGRVCHWILEIHLVEPEGTFGGFYEQLLDIG